MSRKMLLLLALPLALTACDQSAVGPRAVAESDDVTILASSSRLVRTEFPTDEDKGGPFYARIQGVPPFIFVVDGWVVVAFYRQPDCIPEDFNLLGFFDLNAFGCTPTIQGFNLWQGEAFVGAPKIVQSRELGTVPFWFVPLEGVLTAMQDNELTIGELAAIPGRLAGQATHFRETLQPDPLPPFLGGGGHPVPKMIQTARGILDDGRSFQYDVTNVNGVVRHIRLRFQ